VCFREFIFILFLCSCVFGMVYLDAFVSTNLIQDRSKKSNTFLPNKELVFVMLHMEYK